jgi:hypothetical protein
MKIFQISGSQKALLYGFSSLFVVKLTPNFDFLRSYFSVQSVRYQFASFLVHLNKCNLMLFDFIPIYYLEYVQS